MAHIRQPLATRLVPALGHVVSKLDVFAAVQSEPALFERVLDWVWVWRDIAEQMLQTALAVFLGRHGRRRECARKHLGEWLEGAGYRVHWRGVWWRWWWWWWGLFCSPGEESRPNSVSGAWASAKFLRTRRLGKHESFSGLAALPTINSGVSLPRLLFPLTTQESVSFGPAPCG